MVTPRYHIILFWPDEDRGWIADIPDLKPCAAHGDTPAEASAEVLQAVQGSPAVARDRGLPIPGPHYRPANYVA